MINLEKHKTYFINFENDRNFKFEVRGSSFQYYLSFESNYNGILFNMFGINKETFTTQTLGYFLDADWPWCETIYDVNKLLFALLQTIKDKGYKFTCNFDLGYNELYWTD